MLQPVGLCCKATWYSVSHRHRIVFIDAEGIACRDLSTQQPANLANGGGLIWLIGKSEDFPRIWWDFSPKRTFWSPSHRRWILTFKHRAVPWSRSPIVTETNKNGCCTDQSCLAMAIQQQKSTETYRNTPCDAETTRSPAEIAATGVPCLAAGYSPDIAPALPGRTTQKACGRNFCRITVAHREWQQPQ